MAPNVVLTEDEKLALSSPLQGFGASLCGPEPVYQAVERIIAARLAEEIGALRCECCRGRCSCGGKRVS